MSCCPFFFSVPCPLRFRVVDALGHCVSPCGTVCCRVSNSLGGMEQILRNFLGISFHLFFGPPGQQLPSSSSPQRTIRGSLLESLQTTWPAQRSVQQSFMDAAHVDLTCSRISTWGIRSYQVILSIRWRHRIWKASRALMCFLMLSRPHYHREGWKYILHGTLQLWFLCAGYD